MKNTAYIIAMTFVLACANVSHACDTSPIPRSTVPDTGSVYALAALATGGLALARRMMR